MPFLPPGLTSLGGCQGRRKSSTAPAGPEGCEEWAAQVSEAVQVSEAAVSSWCPQHRAHTARAEAPAHSQALCPRTARAVSVCLQSPCSLSLRNELRVFNYLVTWWFFHGAIRASPQDRPAPEMNHGRAAEEVVVCLAVRVESMECTGCLSHSEKGCWFSWMLSPRLFDTSYGSELQCAGAGHRPWLPGPSALHSALVLTAVWLWSVARGQAGSRQIWIPASPSRHPYLTQP